MNVHPCRLFVASVVAALLAGCSSPPPRTVARTYYEEATGSNMTVLAEPMVFVHRQPGLAASGRDYVYLAPLAVSNGGERGYWLWLGLWSTVDRGARPSPAPALRLGAVQLVADDEPIDLEPLVGAGERPGIRAVPYATPVPPDGELLVPVTRSQIERLARARNLRLDDRLQPGTLRRWEGPAAGAAAFAQFAAELAGDGARAASVAGR